MPDHKICTHTLKSKPGIYICSVLAQWVRQDTVFTCPSAVFYKFYLPRKRGNIGPGLLVATLVKTKCEND